MAKQVINIGAAPNDGTGDYIRDSFNKVNLNFTDVYTNFATTNGASFSGLLYVANSFTVTNNALIYGSINAASHTVGTSVVANTSGVFTTGTVNAASHTVGASFVSNSSGVYSTGIVNAASVVVTGNSNTGNLNATGVATIVGNASVNGTLYIAGNTTYVSNTIIASKTMTLKLANGTLSAAAANSAGITIGGTANLIYSYSNNAWQSNVNFVPASNNLGLGSFTNLWNLYSNNMYAYTLSTPPTSSANLYVNPDGAGSLVITQGTGVYVQTTTQATNTSTGALIVSGGASVANNAYFGNSVYVTNAVNAVSYSLGGGIFVANTTTLRASGAIINSTGAFISGLVNSASMNSTIYTVGSSITVNSAGFYTTGTVNAASHTVGSSFLANSTGIYTTGTVNAVSSSVGNTTSKSVANSAGVFVNGTVNAASYTVGSTFVANNTVLNANGLSVNSTGIYGGGLVNAATLSIGSGKLTASVSGVSVNTTLTVLNLVATSMGLGIDNSAQANGYSQLPNSLRMEWGSLVANSTGTTLTFPATFNQVFSVTATSNNNGIFAAVTSLTNSSAVIKTNSATAATIYWMAIGK